MSLNTVAVRLGIEVGPKNVVRTAHRLGISSKLEANPSIALGTSEVSLTRTGRRLCAVRQRRPGRLAACGDEDPHHGGQQAALCAPARSARPGDRAAPCGDDEHHDAGDADLTAPRARRKFRAGSPPARPAPARISAMPGSSATRPTSSPASGSAMTTTRRPRRRPAADCRWKCGPDSCGPRIRACRSRACRTRAAGRRLPVELFQGGPQVSNAPQPTQLQSAQAPMPQRPIPSDNGYRPPPTRASAPPPNPNARPERQPGSMAGWSTGCSAAGVSGGPPATGCLSLPGLIALAHIRRGRHHYPRGAR